ncbi:thiol-disulfide oxidoreductase DCC family protein [Streptomyces sp. NPDC005794]|uniref:thiol-disulfide oxidoreductase DCC family protein n=1 Tax=Streptomyces sp. NPDC005794 TaxID=3364733 RepID=UPI0036C06341
MSNAAPHHAGQRTVLAFDGDCGFCQAAVRQIQTHAKPRTEAAAWQTLPPELTEPHLQRLDREVLLFDGRRVRYGGARALADYLGSSPARPYQVAGRCLQLPLISLVAHLIYRGVAKNRHRMPGGTAACAVPRPNH